MRPIHAKAAIHAAKTRPAIPTLMAAMLSGRQGWCKRSQWLGVHLGDLYSSVRNLLQRFLGDPQQLLAVVAVKNGRRGTDALCADVNFALSLANRLGCFDQGLHGAAGLAAEGTSCLIHASSFLLAQRCRWDQAPQHKR